jgi:regulator of sirC expression with transglutaminase-like and TPR domain
MLHARLGRAPAAVQDWEAYLQRAPDAPDAAVVRDRLRALRQALASRN